MPTRPPFRYDPRVHAYRGPDGRFLRWDGADGVREQMNKALDSAEDRLAALAEQLRAQRMSVATWERQHQEILRQIHGYAAVIARGGHGKMADADWLAVGRKLKEQYKYLRNFAKEIAAGEKYGKVPDGRIVVRARLYAGQARGTYHETMGEVLDKLGFDEERSILEPGDNCEGCRVQAHLGWQKRGQMIPVGTRNCLGNCRCSVERRNSTTKQTFRD